MTRVYIGVALIGANVVALAVNVWGVLFWSLPWLSAALVVVAGMGLAAALYATQQAWRLTKEAT